MNENEFKTNDLYINNVFLSKPIDQANQYYSQKCVDLSLKYNMDFVKSLLNTVEPLVEIIWDVVKKKYLSPILYYEFTEFSRALGETIAIAKIVVNVIKVLIDTLFPIFLEKILEEPDYISYYYFLLLFKK